MKNVLVIAISVLMFSSCETETYVEYKLDNQTNQQLRIDGEDVIHSTTILDSIESQTTKTIAFWSKRGKESSPFEPSSLFGENLVITNAQGDTLKKDYQLLSNWEKNIKESSRTTTHNYTMRIVNTDF